tara:strand:- start:328 stop:639 length:312 start_codon:yes stop_codon:yes gene_type:complete
MEVNDIEFYLFGSYLTSSDFNDIDVLIVVPDVCDIEGANKYISSLKAEYASSMVHTHIYIKSEYLNPRNKFCYKNVSHQISLSEFVNLFSIERHETCNKKGDH